MDSLIERLEKAEGPDREVDADIMAQFFDREERHIGTREGPYDRSYDECAPVKDKVWVDRKTGKWKSTHPYRYTSSIDAALTLAGENAATILSVARNKCVAAFGHGDAFVKQLPRFICLAALKSRGVE